MANSGVNSPCFVKYLVLQFKFKIYVCIQMWSMLLLYLDLQENCKATAHFSSGSENIENFNLRRKNTVIKDSWFLMYFDMVGIQNVRRNGHFI